MEAATHDIKSLLAGGDGRDFLVRSNGDQVKISTLDAPVVGLYFSASWCGPCRNFTPKLIDAYNALASEGNGFEVIFISSDQEEEEFNKYFSKMPWLAIPFSDGETRERLDGVYQVSGIPHLVIVDTKSGEIVTDDAVQYVREYGHQAYPFNREKIDKLIEEEEAAKKAQTLWSILVSPARDYVVSNNGEKVPVSRLEGKIVGLYFFLSGYGSSDEFTSVLTKLYEKLRDNFEVVLVPLDDEQSSFDDSFAKMPWLSLPFKDPLCEKLIRYFELNSLPTLVMIGTDGKTLKNNVADIIEEHGVDAYEGFPFTEEKLRILDDKARAKQEAQTLESLLVVGDLDFVAGKNGEKVPVSELVGKIILLYFSAQWCGPCRAFLPKLIEEYKKIKGKHNDFEIIFISSDQDEQSYDEFYSEMPWLALPFEDVRKTSLKRTFKIRGIPSLIALGPTGRTITTEARGILMAHGADAFPFTDERLKELKDAAEEMAKA